MTSAGSAPLDTLYAAETPEGITLELRAAGMVARSYAYLLDLMIRLALGLALNALLESLGKFGIGLALMVFFALEWLYPVLFELLPGSATPGKRALGLSVVQDSGLPVTPAASLLRNLLRAADFLPFGYALGLLAMLLRADFKRIGDLAAGTLVVHVGERRLHGPLREAPALAPSRPLTTRQQAAVVAWAGRSARLTPERLEELAQLALAGGLKTDAAAAPGATPRLLGIARWLVGHR